MKILSPVNFKTKKIIWLIKSASKEPKDPQKHAFVIVQTNMNGPIKESAFHHNALHLILFAIRVHNLLQFQMAK